MLIKSNPAIANLKRSQAPPSNGSVTLSEQAPAESTDPVDKGPADDKDKDRKANDLDLKKAINGAAYATGGALGGLALGAVSGKVMSFVTHNDVFTTYGGGIGAIGGAATSLAISLSDEPVSLVRTFGSWTGASAGATGGMYVLKGLGNLLAENGASALFGSQGALLGAAAGGLAGAGVAFAGDNSKFGKIAKTTASTATGVTVGLLAGGAVQAFLAGGAMAAVSAPLPLVAAAAAGMVGLNNKINPGWVQNYRFKANSETTNTATKSVLSGAAGYGVGFIAGGIAQAAGGNAAYALAGPALGAAVGAGLALGELTGSKNLTHVAGTAGLAGAGTLAGNLAGYGLSLVTGQGVFSGAGALAGAITGGALYLDANGKAGRYTLPVAGGLSVGTGVGALLGAGLSALTGHSIYQNIGTAGGAAAGLCAGLAGGINRNDPSKGWSV
jgi:hypothetical protein